MTNEGLWVIGLRVLCPSGFFPAKPVPPDLGLQFKHQVWGARLTPEGRGEG
jgi:hypothetical protein